MLITRPQPRSSMPGSDGARQQVRAGGVDAQVALPQVERRCARTAPTRRCPRCSRARRPGRAPRRRAATARGDRVRIRHVERHGQRGGAGGAERRRPSPRPARGCARAATRHAPRPLARRQRRSARSRAPIRPRPPLGDAARSGHGRGAGAHGLSTQNRKNERPRVRLVGIDQAPHARRLRAARAAATDTRRAAGEQRRAARASEDARSRSSRHSIVRARAAGRCIYATPCRAPSRRRSPSGRRATAPGHEGAAAAGLRRAARRSSPRSAGSPTRLRDLTLMGGIHLGDYPWARPEHAALRCATWHMSPRLEDARRRGRVEFVPIRYFDLVDGVRAPAAPGRRTACSCTTAPPDARRLSEPRRLGRASRCRRRARRRSSSPRSIRACRARAATRGCTGARSTCGSRSTSRCSSIRRRPSARSSARSAGTSPRWCPTAPPCRSASARFPQAVLEALGDHRDLALHSLLVDAGGGAGGARRRHRRAQARSTAGAWTSRRPWARAGSSTSSTTTRASTWSRRRFVHDPDVVARLDRFVVDQLGARDRPDRAGDGGEPGRRGRWRASAGSSTSCWAPRARRAAPSIIALPSTAAATARCRGSCRGWRRARR